MSSCLSKASDFYEKEYVIYFSTSNPDYPHFYRLVSYPTKKQADNICDEFKSGQRKHFISGKNNTNAMTNTLQGNYTIKCEHVV